MKEFKKYAFREVCECCGKTTDVVVCGSSVAPVSFRYCEDCLSKGIEPYNALVCSAAEVGHFPDDFNKNYVTHFRTSLDFYRISDEQFNNDIRELEKEMEAYFKNGAD